MTNDNLITRLLAVATDKRHEAQELIALAEAAEETARLLAPKVHLDPGRPCTECDEPLPADTHHLRKVHEGVCEQQRQARWNREREERRKAKQAAEDLEVIRSLEVAAAKTDGDIDRATALTEAPAATATHIYECRDPALVEAGPGVHVCADGFAHHLEAA